MPYDELFRDETEHGLLVALSLDEETARDDEVTPEERALVEDKHPRRRRTFLGGRAALRRALTAHGAPQASILVDARGAPVVHAPYLGSISHKDHVAIALATARDAGGAIAVGVDVEHDRARDTDISRAVLTDRERTSLGRAGLDPAREIVLRFSMKEALYKVLDPFLHRYIGFREVEIDPEADGGARVVLALKHDTCPVDVDVRWRAREGYFVSTARARPRGG